MVFELLGWMIIIGHPIICICRPGLQLQYKYIVVNSDGSVARWMDADNFELQTSGNEIELPGALRVSDSWDASIHAIEVS